MPPIRRTNLAKRSHHARRMNSIRARQTPYSKQLLIARRTTRRSEELFRAAFQYNPTIAYNEHPCLDIGQMNKVCGHCQAFKFETEAQGLCCSERQSYTYATNTSTRAIEHNAERGNTRVKKLPKEHTKLQWVLPNDFIWSTSYSPTRI